MPANWMPQATTSPKQGNGIFDKISRFLIGDEDRNIQQPTATGEQSELLKNLISQLGQLSSPGGSYGQSQDYLSKMLSGDPQAYQNFAAPHIQNFEQQIIPRLAERFGGMEGPFSNAGDYSGFAQAAGGAGAQLQAQLAGLYGNLQQGAAGQAQNQYSNLANLGLGTRQFENQYQPGSTGFLGGIAAGVGQGAGEAGGIAGMMKLLPLLGLL